MKIKIKVTKEVLRKTAFCGGAIYETCAFAYALRELIPYATVGFYYFNFGGYGNVKQPDDIHRWILMFDDAGPKERLNLPEISCEIELPQQVIERIGISEVYRVLSESKTLELVKI